MTDSTDDFGKAITAALADLCPMTEVRRLMTDPLGHNPAVWRRLAREIGIPGLAVPEEYGGSGGALEDLAVVFEAAGSALACLPLFATCALAAPLLVAVADEEAKKHWLPRLSSGENTATVAFAAFRGAAGTAPRAVRDDDGWRLTGTYPHVVDGAGADLLLAIADTDAGPGVFVLEGEGTRRTPLAGLDLTRRLARVTADRARATPVAEPGEQARPSLEAAWDAATALLTAEQVGGAQHCLDMTAEHARTRIQFARPIGSFQAVKQRLADMLIKVELARSAAGQAVRAASGGDVRERALAVSVAKSFCSDAYAQVTGATIQLHGGLGFTWEHDAHLYYKRALSSREILGTPALHDDRVAELL
ncbi:acyl-CoA dehydrogenase family protein [Streptomyces sp. NPDC002896]|uniref:acyl-CoA dehydrogenase family protein n=1 Tax=Streptomyces sp. NPDC002896 TaxID=3154438 RepID=UPI00332A6AD6